MGQSCFPCFDVVHYDVLESHFFLVWPIKRTKKKVFKEQNVHAPKLKLREIPLPYPCLKEVQKHFNPKAQTPILLIKNFLNMKARFKITSIFFQVACKKHRVQLIGKILKFIIPLNLNRVLRIDYEKLPKIYLEYIIF